MKGYMLDTNVFNEIINGGHEEICSRHADQLFVTRVQVSELWNIQNLLVRESLVGLFERLNPTKLPTRSGVWVDELHWDDDQPWIDDITPECSQFIEGTTTNPWRDAMIADTAFHHGLTLVTNDGQMRRRAARMGLSTLEPDSFFRTLHEQGRHTPE